MLTDIIISVVLNMIVVNLNKIHKNILTYSFFYLQVKRAACTKKNRTV